MRWSVERPARIRCRPAIARYHRGHVVGNDHPAPRGPLAGIVVVDCSTVLAGPYCTMLLADLGADVVKVEPPDGDGTRAWGPPWVGAGRLARRPGVAAYYLAVNRNKRSIRLDLKTAAGRDVLGRLLADADVLVENFRVGGFAGSGFDDDALDGAEPATRSTWRSAATARPARMRPSPATTSSSRPSPG